MDLAETTDELTSRFLLERHLISRELANGTGGRGVLFNKSEMLAVMVNEEDHLRMQAIRAGFQVQEAYHDIQWIDDHLDKDLEFAFSDRFGYLIFPILVGLVVPYLLIGVGRWGTLDPWLGIPVTWEQISGAKTIIETNFKDFDVQPSQGTHFFQNLTSFKVGYFTVNDPVGKGFVNWEWLGKQKAVDAKTFVRHLQIEKPITIKINGQENRGVILKPEEE